MKGKDKFPALLFLSGPTGSGKSALAEHLAGEYDLPIISADSRQIYRYFNIGTAKPEKEILDAHRYEMIDILEPEEKFSAGMFARRTKILIEEKYQSFPVIIIAGGTGFYISALLEGLADVPAITPETDQKWEDYHATEGLQAIREQIREKDPLFFRKGDMENPRRLLRALKVIDQTGKSILSYNPRPILRQTTPRLELAIRYDRPGLYEKIDRRVDAMVQKGLVEEAESLLKFRKSPAMRTVGYRELLPFFDGKISQTEAVEKIKQHSRNYAKRQMTWLRKHGDWQWIESNDKDAARQWIRLYL